MSWLVVSPACALDWWLLGCARHQAPWPEIVGMATGANVDLTAQGWYSPLPDTTRPYACVQYRLTGERFRIVDFVRSVS